MDGKGNLVNCLICGVANCEKDKLANCSVFGGEIIGNLVSRHLQVIFVLRNVLEVPVEKLVNYLEREENVEGWISVCDKCEQMISSGKEAYQDVLRAQREFRIVKQEIIQSLKESSQFKKEKGEEDDEDVILIATNITEEIREFVSQNEYAERIEDPFIFGDRLCKEKLSKIVKAEEEEDENGPGSPISLLVDVDEDCVFLDSDDDDDDDDHGSDSDMDSEENGEEIQILRQEQREATKLEDPLSLPVTIDLDDDNDQKQDGDDDDTKDNNEDDDDEKIKVEEDRKLIKIEKKGKKDSPKLKGLPSPISHSEDIFSCPICNKKYSSFGECNMHIQCLHFARTKYICDRCGSTTDGQDKLLKHQRICTGISYPCPLAPSCLRRFFKIHSLRIHLRDTHGKDEAHLPPKIQKMLKKMRELNNTKKCNICGKIFKTWTLCQRHREFVHEKKWRCSRCGVVRWSKGDLDKHQLNCEEEGGKSWVCPVEECGLIYKSFRALTIHMGRVHKDKGKLKMEEGDRPVVICEGCGATFRGKFKLNAHQKSSVRCRRIRGLEPVEKKKGEGEEALKVICQVCGKCYSDRKGLRGHVRRIHENKYSKRCEICGRGFMGGSGLKMHLWTRHGMGEGDKGKWVCEVEGCGVVVVGKKREVHMRKMHGERERMWGCGECGRRYMHERSLLQHSKEVHLEGRRFGKKREGNIEGVGVEGEGVEKM